MFFQGYEESSNGKLMHTILRIAQFYYAIQAIRYLIVFILSLVRGDGSGLQSIFFAIVCAGIVLIVSSRLD